MILSKWYVASLTNLSSFVNCLLGLPCRNKNNLSDHCLQIMSMFLTCHFPDIKLFLYAMSCTGCHLEGCFQHLETFLRTSLVPQWERTHLPVQEPLETWVQSQVRKSPWRWTWQPTPVFVPGESHGRRSLAGHSPQGHRELNWVTETHTETFLTVTLGACSWHGIIGDVTRQPAVHRTAPCSTELSSPKCQ